MESTGGVGWVNGRRQIGAVLVLALFAGCVGGPPESGSSTYGPSSDSEPASDSKASPIADAASTEAAEGWQMARQNMILEIESDVRETVAYTGKNQLDSRVMAALAEVPRHELVPEDLRSRAYVNRPLPIGRGQTISQPYIVALMSDLLETQPHHRVLEVGTGSGYQAAVLAELVAEVHTIEIVEELFHRARHDLERLGFDNIRTRLGDGYAGWPEAAPFDGILITAACPEVPAPLLDQLRPGGRMVLPLDKGRAGEELTVVVKGEDGRVEYRGVLPVRFVPLTGEHGLRPSREPPG